MELNEITVKVHLACADDAAKAAMDLVQKINEAKTLAGELASLIEKLEVKVDK